MGVAPECLVESKTPARTKVVEVFHCVALIMSVLTLV